jgi:major vault protein
VLGEDEGLILRCVEQFFFPQNNLVITSIDIQSVEPVDQRTRDSLQKSVQLAIEITTNSKEAAAKYEFFRTNYKFISILIFLTSNSHEAERLKQEARGRLERQKIRAGKT